MGRYDDEVMNAVGLRGTVSVAELAALLDVSEQTVRRIVKPMVARGDVEKVHGAIRANNYRANNHTGNNRTGTGGALGQAPFLTRMNVNQRAKLAIATEVAGMISDGDTIALDTGSTTGFIAQALRQHRGLTVVTNSSFIATSLATIPGNRVHMAGVELRNHDGASFDRSAFAVVAAMRVRWAILSTSAVDRRRGCMVHELCEAEMSAAMGDIADTRIVAVDHTKFGTSGLVAMAQLCSGDVVVTDQAAPRGFVRALAPAAVRVAQAS